MRNRAMLGIVVTALVAVSVYVLPRFVSWSALSVAIPIGFAVTLVFLVRWHAAHTGYVCLLCDHIFAVTAWCDFLSPHQGAEKMLRCPRCGESSWCREIDRPKGSDMPVASYEKVGPSHEKTGGVRFQIVLVITLFAALVLYTIVKWSSLPSAMQGFEAMKIPLATLILPILQVIFCAFAVRQGYRSRIYPVLTLFVTLFMLMAVWMQYVTLNGPR